MIEGWTKVPSDRGFDYASWRPVARLALTPSVAFASDRTTVTTASPPVYYRTGRYVRADFVLTEQLSIGVGARNLFDECHTLTDGFPEAGRSFFAVGRAVLSADAKGCRPLGSGGRVRDRRQHSTTLTARPPSEVSL